jgi:hypothetical protein
MAGSPLRAVVLAALALQASACDRLPHRAGNSSVTIKLPPATAPSPGFTFDGAQRPANVDLR